MLLSCITLLAGAEGRMQDNGALDVELTSGPGRAGLGRAGLGSGVAAERAVMRLVHGQ